MVGRDVELALDRAGDVAALAGAAAVVAADEGPPARAAAPAGPPALAVRDLVVAAPRRPRAVDGVSFDIAAGEILGIAGVEGNGQTELVEALAGLAPAAAGRVVLAGRDVTALGVRARADAGLSHIPEDRHRRGLVLDYSVADNLVLGLQHRYARGGLSAVLGRRLDRARVDADARRLVRDFDIRPADPALPARALSGGNQQKIVVAREMTGRDYAVLLAAQPTRGVDVGAIEFIHDQLRRARDAGKGVLLVSADLAEVLALADRVAVMYEGRFAAVLSRAEATLERLGPLMTGADQVGAAA
jgi:simple sugar transport system ATP-binding protein